MNILVIEDEARIASFIERGLAAEGMAVDLAADGIEGLEKAETADYDLVVLDLMLPKLNGEEVLRRLRRAGHRMPVIVLTAKDDVSDRVANLNAGADDYLGKPFSFSELLARIRVRLRNVEQATADRVEAAGVVLDLRRRTASHEGTSVDLSAREFALLETFLRHPGQVLSQTQLLDQVWGFDFEPGSNIVEVYVGYLRRKLTPDLIETVRGAGYRLRA